MDMNERMTRVETLIESINEKVSDTKILLSNHVSWEENKYKDFSSKFAYKWTEKLIIAAFLLAIGTAFAFFSK